MKKITLLCIAFVVFAFTSQIHGQSITNQNFGTNGPDAAPTVLAINSGSITVNQGQPITAVTLSNFVSHYNTATGTTTWCNNWYAFNLVVTGGVADGTSIVEGCAADFEGLDVTGFTTMTLTTVDLDSFTDTVYFDVDLVVTYDTPSCPSPTGLLVSGITESSATIDWSLGGTEAAWEYALVAAGSAEPTSGTPIGLPTYEATLNPSTSYDFYVRADCTGGDYSAWSMVSFVSSDVAPDCASTPFPADGAVDVPAGAVTFTWTAPGAGITPTSYNLYAVDNLAGDNPVLIGNFLTTSAAIVINVYNTQIFWQVLPVNGTAEATGCAVWNFTTQATPAPPANDDCSGAQLIVQETDIATAADATPTPGSIIEATASGLAAELCGGFTGTANDDVWYAFTALTANVTITYDITGGVLFDGVAQLYSGACGTLAVVGCADNTVATVPVVEEIQATGLIVGDTYYTRIYQYSGASTTVGKKFNIKIWSSDALSINEFENATFSFSPNPVKNTLNLKAQSNIQKVSVYNMLGQEVAKTAPNALNSELDMSALQTGAYFVKVTINDTTETVRVNKQ